MMRKIILGCLLALSAMQLFAQDAVVANLRDETGKRIKKEADTMRWCWKRGGLINANFAQGSLSNWAAGGDNFAMSLNAYVNYYLYYLKGRHSWDNNLDFNLGYIETTSLGGRKNDDRLELLSKYGYKLDSGKWYLTGLADLRTQLFDGYAFSGTTSDFSSSLLSPAYLTVSIGLDYKPNNKFSFFISPLTSRWVIVENNYLAAKGLYGLDSGKHVINQIGAYMSVNYVNEIAKGITYKGRLDLFSNYKHNPQNVDFFMTNLIAFKINKYFAATYSLDMIYDDDIKQFGPNLNSPRLQLKSLIGIGFMMPIKPIRK
jgi:hypothetical protein